jgi:drug/metabolite transporter (DMT)-like permease
MFKIGSPQILGWYFDLSEQSRAIVLILASTFCFTGMHTVIRYAATVDDMHPFEIAFFRNIFGLLVLAPFFWRNGLGVLRTEKFHLHAVRGFIQIMWYCYTSVDPLVKPEPEPEPEGGGGR